ETVARRPDGIDLGPRPGERHLSRGAAAAARQGDTDPVDDYGVRLSVRSRADERRTFHQKTAAEARRCRLCENAERTETTGRQSNGQQHRRLHLLRYPNALSRRSPKALAP